jgi:hypothetical protein
MTSFLSDVECIRDEAQTTPSGRESDALKKPCIEAGTARPRLFTDAAGSPTPMGNLEIQVRHRRPDLKRTASRARVPTSSAGRTLPTSGSNLTSTHSRP